MTTFIKPKRAVLLVFDLDGTIYPRSVYMALYYELGKLALAELAGVPASQTDSVLSDAGISREATTSTGSITQLLSELGVSRDAWNQFRDKHFDVSDRLSINHELVDVFQMLRSKYRLALLTNNTRVGMQRVLSRVGLDPAIFEIVITSDDGMNSKPSETPFIMLAQRLGVPYTAMLSIGDRQEIDIDPLTSLGGEGVLIEHPSDILTLARNELLCD
jgi:HAD superfamily hydrolase (TIGR01549 family)